MVTKRGAPGDSGPFGSVLAKIHMVTKQPTLTETVNNCSVLAKIHMVTKPGGV